MKDTVLLNGNEVNWVIGGVRQNKETIGLSTVPELIIYTFYSRA